MFVLRRTSQRGRCPSPDNIFDQHRVRRSLPAAPQNSAGNAPIGDGGGLDADSDGYDSDEFAVCKLLHTPRPQAQRHQTLFSNSAWQPRQKSLKVTIKVALPVGSPERTRYRRRRNTDKDAITAATPANSSTTPDQPNWKLGRSSGGPACEASSTALTLVSIATPATAGASSQATDSTVPSAGAFGPSASPSTGTPRRGILKQRSTTISADISAAPAVQLGFAAAAEYLSDTALRSLRSNPGHHRRTSSCASAASVATVPPPAYPPALHPRPHTHDNSPPFQPLSRPELTWALSHPPTATTSSSAGAGKNPTVGPRSDSLHPRDGNHTYTKAVPRRSQSLDRGDIAISDARLRQSISRWYWTRGTYQQQPHDQQPPQQQQAPRPPQQPTLHHRVPSLQRRHPLLTMPPRSRVGTKPVEPLDPAEQPEVVVVWQNGHAAPTADGRFGRQYGLQRSLSGSARW
ncbi:hypothetical protein DFJ73DRAFT_763932 [Zopfochytrium polystomum]|nr:hypothetical protein DFJ73DRAFT_763932 [Zopfochytrium polystomum]